jgi:uncharacterized protein YdcH (DUF465 family)
MRQLFAKFLWLIENTCALLGARHDDNQHSAAAVNLQTRGVPMDLHHPFVAEFPAHRETIRSLKLADGKFRQMFDEYHQLDDEICRIEEDVEFATDQQIDELKFKRAKLKDALYNAVQKHESTLVAR